MADRHLTCAYRSHDSAGVLYVNTFSLHETWGDIEPTPGMGDTANAIDSWLTSLYVHMLSVSYTVDTLAIRELNTALPKAHEKATGGAGSITSGSGPLPREVCQLVTLKSDVATRSGRGRMFIPSPLASSFLSANDAWNTAGVYWTAATAFFNALITPHTFAYGSGGIYNATLTAEIWSATHGQGYDVTSFVQRQAPHWLRSRSTAP